MNIPPKFYKGRNHPTARTVGELKAALAELPDDLRVDIGGFGAAMELVVYNHGTDSEHLGVREHDENK